MDSPIFLEGPFFCLYGFRSLEKAYYSVIAWTGDELSHSWPLNNFQSRLIGINGYNALSMFQHRYGVINVPRLC